MTGKPTLLLEHHLKELKLPSFLREYGKMAAQCAAEGVDHPSYLLRLAGLELIDRQQRMVERRIRAARFPAVKSLDTFDFTAIPSMNKALVMELARSEYIERRDNVIAAGNSGAGKTHVALGLGLAARQRGMSVGFTRAAAFPSQPADHRRAGLRPPVLHRRGTALRGLRLGAPHRRAAGPSHPPCAHPGDERRQLPSQAQPGERQLSASSRTSGSPVDSTRNAPRYPLPGPLAHLPM